MTSIADLLQAKDESYFYLEHTCQLVQTLFGFDTVLVTILDEKTQHIPFKSGIISANETPRSVAFCRFTVQQDNIFEVLNPLAHPYFADNPLVVTGPKIRYYAGAPLTLDDGSHPGALCLISNTERKPLTQEQRGQLMDFAMIISRELEQTATIMKLKAQINSAKA